MCPYVPIQTTVTPDGAFKDIFNMGSFKCTCLMIACVYDFSFAQRSDFLKVPEQHTTEEFDNS